MPRPTTREDLLDRMEAEFAALFDAVEAVDRERLTEPGACEHWSVKDLLAHLDAWHELFLGWEEMGRAGSIPAMPAPGFTWKDTPALNAAIWRATRDDSFENVRRRLLRSYDHVRATVEAYGDDLFETGIYPWTGSTSVGSYAVSATSSHYEWARKLVRRFNRQPAVAATRP